MAAFYNYPSTETWQTGGQVHLTMTYQQYVTFLSPSPSAPNPFEGLSGKAVNAIRLAGLHPPRRPHSDARPRCHVSRTRLVRRELQRSGAVGFARLGGRRPL